MKAKQLGARRQQGLVVALLAILLAVAAVALVAFKFLPNDTALRRSQVTMRALATAREALIGYAVQRGDIAGNARPGEFPCPDTNNDGRAEVSCGSAVNVAIGRIPWVTLGIPEPKDDYGETLWYALDSRFRQRFSGSQQPINSDTRARTLVYANDGVTLLTAPGVEAVAVVFSPGSALPGQSRDTATQRNARVNYLDTASGRNNADVAGRFIAADLSPAFNDRLIYITTSDFMPIVERRVAAEVRTILDQYYAVKGYYPYPARHDDPLCLDTGPSASSTACPSDLSRCRGRLPEAALPSDWGDDATVTPPLWFYYNLWSDVIYYAVGADYLQNPPANCSPSLKLGSTSGIKVVYFLPGPPLGAILRPGVNLSDYLEDATNQQGWNGAPPAIDQFATPPNGNDQPYPIP
jgi:hypothetical protein